MNKFFFAGRLAAAPVMTRHGQTVVAKFRLIRNEYAGKDDDGDGKERDVAIPFVCFGPRAEAVAKNVMKGDQLLIEARVENNNFTDNEGQDHYEYNFVVQNFEFGAPGPEKRKQLAERG